MKEQGWGGAGREVVLEGGEGSQGARGAGAERTRGVVLPQCIQPNQYTLSEQAVTSDTEMHAKALDTSRAP